MVKTLFISIWLLYHPVHVTLTSIDYIPELGCFKVFIRMYFDDFLIDCTANGNEVKKEDFSGNHPTAKKVMEKYLSEKLILKVNDDQLYGKMQDLQIADNEININLNYECDERPGIIAVKGLIMTGLYNDQANMVIVKINDFEEGVKLTSDVTQQIFQIK